MVGTKEDVQFVLGNDVEARFPLHAVTSILVTDNGADKLACEHPSIRIAEMRDIEHIVSVAAELSCDSVWIASPGALKDKNIRRIVWALKDLRVRLYVEPMLGGIEGTRISHERVGTRTVMLVKKPRFDGANGFAKRVIDILGSAVIILMISPVLLVTAIAVKLEDGGPIFYKSERIGHRGEPFMMWKFRSMVVDADKQREKLASQTGKSAFLFKMKDDPRVTKVGRFIRKTSIDELPQFFNSFNGTMSIVGPRPPLPSEAQIYNSDMRMRLEVKPGITGLWQVNGRSDLTPVR